MSAVAAGLQWLDTVLTGDATYMSYLPGGVHRSLAPTGTAFPFAIIHPQSLMDKNSATALRIYSPDLFLVKAIGDQAGLQALISAADRAFFLINRINNVAVSNGLILASYREQEVYYQENIGGVERIHLGGLYRIQIK